MISYMQALPLVRALHTRRRGQDGIWYRRRNAYGLA